MHRIEIIKSQENETKPTHQIGTRNRAGIFLKPMQDDQSTNLNPFSLYRKLKILTFQRIKNRRESRKRSEQLIPRGKLINRWRLYKGYSESNWFRRDAKEDDDEMTILRRFSGFCFFFFIYSLDREWETYRRRPRRAFFFCNNKTGDEFYVIIT